MRPGVPACRLDATHAEVLRQAAQAALEEVKTRLPLPFERVAINAQAPVFGTLRVLVVTSARPGQVDKEGCPRKGEARLTRFEPGLDAPSVQGVCEVHAGDALHCAAEPLAALVQGDKVPVQSPALRLLFSRELVHLALGHTARVEDTPVSFEMQGDFEYRYRSLQLLCFQDAVANEAEERADRTASELVRKAGAPGQDAPRLLAAASVLDVWGGSSAAPAEVPDPCVVLGKRQGHVRLPILHGVAPTGAGRIAHAASLLRGVAAPSAAPGAGASDPAPRLGGPFCRRFYDILSQKVSCAERDSTPYVYSEYAASGRDQALKEWTEKNQGPYLLILKYARTDEETPEATLAAQARVRQRMLKDLAPGRGKRTLLFEAADVTGRGRMELVHTGVWLRSDDVPAAWKLPSFKALSKTGDLQLIAYPWSKARFEVAMLFESAEGERREQEDLLMTRLLAPQELFDLEAAEKGRPGVPAPGLLRLLAFCQQRMRQRGLTLAGEGNLLVMPDEALRTELALPVDWGRQQASPLPEEEALPWLSRLAPFGLKSLLVTDEAMARMLSGEPLLWAE